MSDRLNAVFSALADPTRRAILARLAVGEASVTELARPFSLSQPAISKHLKVLESAGLITAGQAAQRRPRRIQGAPLKEVAEWLEHYRHFWEASFDRLENYLAELKLSEAVVGMNSTDNSTADRELSITRILDAPRALVFKAWTDPTHLARWSGPRGFTTTQDKMELRPGGAYRACLHAPDGTDHWVRGVYREIVEPERLVFTHAWEDKDGVPGTATLVTVTFADHGGKTEMIFHQALFDTVASRDGHRGGWSQSFDRLDEHLATLRAASAGQGTAS